MGHQRNVSPCVLSHRRQWQRREKDRGGTGEGLHSSVLCPLAGCLLYWLVRCLDLQADSGSRSAEAEGFPTADLESAGTEGMTKGTLPLSHIPKSLQTPTVTTKTVFLCELYKFKYNVKEGHRLQLCFPLSFIFLSRKSFWKCNWINSNLSCSVTNANFR